MIVHEVSTPDAMDYAIMNPMHNPYYNSFYNYVKDQFHGLYEKLGSVGKAFIDKAANIFNTIYNENYLRRMSIIDQMTTDFTSPYSYYYISEPDQFRYVGLAMQRAIMAQPYIRQQYLEQRIDGYSDTYVNLDGKKIGEDHYDYRRVMHGILHEVNDITVACEYLDVVDSEERPMTVLEQHNVLRVWEAAEWMLRRGIDITDPYREDDDS